MQQLYIVFALFEVCLETSPALSGFDSFCSQRSNIASDRFYRMHTKKPWKVQLNWWRGFPAIQISSGNSFSQRKYSLKQLTLIWAQGASTPSGHIENTGASNLPVLFGPATPRHQVLNHQIKRWTNSSPKKSYCIRYSKGSKQGLLISVVIKLLWFDEITAFQKRSCIHP